MLLQVLDYSKFYILKKVFGKCACELLGFLKVASFFHVQLNRQELAQPTVA